MKSRRPPPFWKRKFEPHVIVTCVRWYYRFALSLRDLEELMAERTERSLNIRPLPVVAVSVLDSVFTYECWNIP
jgi:hypothetical protein